MLKAKKLDVAIALIGIAGLVYLANDTKIITKFKGYFLTNDSQGPTLNNSPEISGEIPEESKTPFLDMQIRWWHKVLDFFNYHRQLYQNLRTNPDAPINPPNNDTQLPADEQGP